MKKRNFLILIAILFAITSCNKIDEITDGGIFPPSKSSPQEQMRYFTDFEELKNEVDKTLGFSLDELIAYEKSIDFNSFGKLAELAMEPLLREVESKTITSTRVSQVLSVNSELLQIVTDEDGDDVFETKCSKSPYRYIMNTNCMFQAEKLCYKVFEEGHVSCDAEYYNELFEMTEHDFATLESNEKFCVFKYKSGAKGNYGQQKEVKAEKDKEQVRVMFYYVQVYRTMINGQVCISGLFCVKTRGYQKALGTWWQVRRTCENDLTAYINVYQSVVSGKDKGSTLAYKREEVLRAINITLPVGVSSENIYIHSASGIGKTPPVTCVIELL